METSCLQYYTAWCNKDNLHRRIYGQTEACMLDALHALVDNMLQLLFQDLSRVPR